MEVNNIARLVTDGSIAIFEYPEGATNPKFSIDEDGVLWIEGYNMPFPWAPETPVRVVKRFETHLIHYKVAGRVAGIFTSIIDKANIDKSRFVVLVKDPEYYKDESNVS